ncbi:MAG: transcriptional regulator, partial [Pyrinomonadaceae bacterium]|nr:transcriptional regulator [Pyrinomonadaceae bacterium]
MSNKIRHFYEFEDFRFVPEERCLWQGDELLSLSPKALDVLNLLLQQPNEVVTREKLLESVWEETFVDESNLTVAVSNLRKVLEQHSSTPKEFIRTIPKKGYRFVSEVEKVFQEEAEDEVAKFEAPQLPPESIDISDRSAPPVRWHFVGIILLGVLFLTSFGLWINYSRETGLSSVPVNERNIKSIAVLPLK